MNFFGRKIGKNKVFLDYASITPIDRRVAEAMRECNSETFANPAALYNEALLAKEKVSEARKKIADILNCQKDEIFFTSSGTESNNLALLGLFEAHKTKDFIPHIIVSQFEHPSVLEVCKEIEKRGGQVTYVPVSEEGLVSAKSVAGAIKNNTILVSVMYANNEIGTIQPVKEIGRAIKEYRNKNKTSLPFFHTDACQAGLYLTLDILKLGLDLMTLDGIKIYGPRGVGFLYIKRETKISPVLFGGGQEKSLRSGTENVPGIVGLAKAMEIAEEMKERESARLLEVRDYAISEILKNFPKASLNGSRNSRLPNNINICFPGLDAEFGVISLDVLGVSASYSSSCRTLKEDSSSYVVEAIGKKDCALSSLRFTLGRESIENDIDTLISTLKKIMVS